MAGRPLRRMRNNPDYSNMANITGAKLRNADLQGTTCQTTPNTNRDLHVTHHPCADRPVESPPPR